MTLTRREAVAALAASAAALPLVSCRRAGPAATDADASKLLDSIGENLLRLSPTGATSLGVDTGANAALRSQLDDRSPAGQQRLASLLKQVNRVLLSLRGLVSVEGLHSWGTVVEVGGQHCFNSVGQEERCEPC